MTVPVAITVEALLFVAHEPLSTARLAQLSGHAEAEVQEALAALSAGLAQRGWRLTRLGDSYQLTTAPETDEAVRRYLQAESRNELSKAALETLAIIAYRGPLTRSELESIRGVASDTMLRNLLQRGLIREEGPAEAPGRPLQYGVSQAFLRHFGLTSLEALPPLPEAPDT